MKSKMKVESIVKFKNPANSAEKGYYRISGKSGYSTCTLSSPFESTVAFENVNIEDLTECEAEWYAAWKACDYNVAKLNEMTSK